MSWRSNGPQAQPLAPVLMERARVLADTSLSPPRLDLSRLRSESEQLLKSDAVGAHELLGAVACLRQKPDEARHHHQNAIRLYGDEMRVFNYGTSLVRMGFFDEGIAQYHKAFELNPSHVKPLRELVRTSLRAGYVTEAERWLEELVKRTPEDSAMAGMEVRAVREFLSQYDVDELHLQALVSRCISILHEKSIWALRTSLWIVYEDEQLVIQFRVPFETDFGDLLDAVAVSLSKDEIPAEVDGRVVPYFLREHKDEDQWPSLRVIS